MLSKVDHSAIKVNQAAIISLSVLSFIFDFAWLVALVAIIMAAGSLLGRPGFLPVYHGILRPRGWVKPEVLSDNPEPHLFAQGFGAVVLASGCVALFLGATSAGWTLVWLVIGLAALNLFAGFCAGCAMYYWLGRLGIPGLNKKPPEGVFPGVRPGTPATEN